jgi:uncharacterized membrane protein YhaH (DUF805 family)
MSSRSVRSGLLGIAGLAAFYLVVVGVASGSIDHLVDQIRSDWWLLAPITAGFGVQVGLMSELRHRHHAASLAAGAASAGAGTSAAGMIACCAHHLAELVPFLGLAGVATTLTAWRTEMMLVGLAVNVIAITLAVRRLRAIGPTIKEVDACAVA